MVLWQESPSKIVIANMPSGHDKYWCKQIAFEEIITVTRVSAHSCRIEQDIRVNVFEPLPQPAQAIAKAFILKFEAVSALQKCYVT